MDVHGFDREDNLLHVVVYGRITGAEIEVHTIALDGRMDDGAESESASCETWRPASEPSERRSGRHA